MKFSTFVLFSLSLIQVALSLPSESNNAQRLARGLPPLRPRRLYNAHIARTLTASATPTASTPAATATPTGLIQAVYVSSINGVQPSVEPLRRRQTIGTVAGYLNQVGQLSTTNRNIRFSTTTDPEAAVAVYATDYANPTAQYPISQGFMCLNNDHSLDASRDYPIVLSPDTGDYVGLSFCGAYLDRPAGTPPANDLTAVEPQFYGETRVWGIDPTTGLVSFRYVNPDGTIPSPQYLVSFTCPDFGVPTILWTFVTSNMALFREEMVAKLLPGSVADTDLCTVNELAMTFQSL
ncbi:hypothetical protein C8Q75DRAFT_769303 [Abortiporus biennis]|nr:hypothetical protein C8Q75DRAFT_769303 [Abortiporus biennis]